MRKKIISFILFLCSFTIISSSFIFAEDYSNVSIDSENIHLISTMNKYNAFNQETASKKLDENISSNGFIYMLEHYTGFIGPKSNLIDGKYYQNSPSETINIGQMSNIMSAFFDKTNVYNIKVSEKNDEIKNISEIPDSYAKNIIKIYNLGVIELNSEGKIDFSEEITLEKAIKYIIKFVGKTSYDIKTEVVFDEIFLPIEENNDDTFITLEEVAKDLGEIFKNTSYNIIEKEKEATYKDIINIIYYFSDGKFFTINKNFDYVYVLENTAWLSDKEYLFIKENFENKIPRYIYNILKERTIEALNILNNNQLLNYEEYLEFCNFFLPDYVSFIVDGKAGAEYWLKNLEKDGIVDDIGNVLHELQHELSARKSHIFRGRRYKKTAFYVDYTSRPSVIHYYDNLKNVWTKSNSDYLPQSHILMINAPEAIQSLYHYEFYVEDDYLVSDIWGINGIMTEYCSYAINMKIETIFENLNYNDIVYSYYVSEFQYFWKGFVLEYLNELKETNFSQYKRLLNNKDFINIICNTIDFGDQQVSYSNSINYNWNDGIACINWTEQDYMKEQYNILKDASNGIILVLDKKIEIQNI